jgi:hypothetical protein
MAESLTILTVPARSRYFNSNRLCPAIAERMNPLRERLLDVFARGMIELAQPCMPGFDLNHSTASTCSLALKHRDQHSRRTHFHAATVVLLKGFVAQLLCFDGSP